MLMEFRCTDAKLFRSICLNNQIDIFLLVVKQFDGVCSLNYFTLNVNDPDM